MKFRVYYSRADLVLRWVEFDVDGDRPPDGALLVTRAVGLVGRRHPGDSFTISSIRRIDPPHDDPQAPATVRFNKGRPCP